MKIDHVKTMTRIGQIVKRDDHDKKLIFKYDDAVTNDLLKDERGRVYAIVVNGEIHKIGGSQSKGGIKATFDAYFSGFSYGMSARTYCVWNYINQAIESGDVVEAYCVWAPTVEVDIPTMQGNITKEIPVDFHSIEDAFTKEYVNEEGRFPELNIQESGRKWEDTGLLEGWPGMAKRFEPQD